MASNEPYSRKNYENNSNNIEQRIKYFQIILDCIFKNFHFAKIKIAQKVAMHLATYESLGNISIKD